MFQNRWGGLRLILGILSKELCSVSSQILARTITKIFFFQIWISFILRKLPNMINWISGIGLILQTWPPETCPDDTSLGHTPYSPFVVDVVASRQISTDLSLCIYHTSIQHSLFCFCFAHCFFCGFDLNAYKWIDCPFSISSHKITCDAYFFCISILQIFISLNRVTDQ